MRTGRFTLFAALVLGGLISAATMASAQSTNAPGRAERRMTVQQRVDRMGSDLKLTDDQKTKVKALFEAQTKKRQELRADTSLSREDRRDKGRALMEEETKKLKEILTADQLEKWQKMRPQGRARRSQTGPAPAK